MSEYTKGRLDRGSTFSTHNSPSRFWETNVYANKCLLVAKCCGSAAEESQANAEHIVKLWNLNEEYDLEKVGEVVEALQYFANFACSPSGECNCNNCRARDVIQNIKREQV